jgi:hypothetical protein
MVTEWPGPDGEPREPAPLRTVSVVGIVVSTIVAVVGLFALPTLTASGLTFSTAFWLLCGVELAAALGITVSVLNLHEE